MHTEYMQRCLELARRGKSSAAPNPMVGAVLVHNGRIIGEGWHQQYGQAHAEVNCINSVRPEDRHLIAEATIYVCLEPCAHFGKTPPCAELLVREQVKEVIIANIDPFARVDGNGIAILERGNIPARHGLLAASGNWLNRRFFCFHQQQRPYIILKWAVSAEGNMAAADNSRTQLSNHYSNSLVHQWRTEEAAIMVGYNTALHDNPQLTARHWQGPQPLRIVLDRQLQLPHTHHLFNAAAPTWIINEQKEETQENLVFKQLPFDQHLLPALLEQLHRQQRLSLIVEGGPALLNSFIKQGLWDEARIFKTKASLPDGTAAPTLTGGRLVSDTAVCDDRLQLWTRSNTSYAYVPGMNW